MVKIKYLGMATIFIVICAMVMVSTIFTIEQLNLIGLVNPLLIKIKNRLLTYAGEYLFFVGTTYISLLLLKQKKWVWAKISFLVGVGWVILWDSVFGFIGALGTDSFTETKDFDLNEAKFWLTTLTSVLEPNLSLKLFSFYIVLAVCLCLSYLTLQWFFSKIRFTAKKNYLYVQFFIASIIIAVAIQKSFSDSIKLFFAHSESYELTKRNFTNPIPEITVDRKPTKLLVYIGESTSIMNMGVYGYPRDTTPLLSKLAKEDLNLILFKNVFSTHTHTSPSLLEALSFGLNERDSFLPINQRKRVSIVDILHAGGIDVSLYSTQGQTGTVNQVSPIIFNNAKRTFSNETKYIGNVYYKLENTWDHEFFNTHLKFDNKNKVNLKEALTFFHSYAGHGEYLKNIPESFRQTVDDQFKDRNKSSIVGSNTLLFADVEKYDSAIKYVDFAVAQAIEAVKASNDPQIFLYFSDHGDAAYAGRGHDSSRFIHEMVRIPFLMYFNEAAKNADINLFEKYQQLAKNEEISTLAQLPSTIFNLLGVNFTKDSENNVLQTPIIGKKTTHPPILVRETIEGITYVNLNKERFSKTTQDRKDIIEKSDEATRSFMITHTNKSEETSVCYHRSNTLGKALRGKMVADCLEVDIVAENDGSIAVYHPPAKNSGFNLKDILNLTSNDRYALWLSGKNIQSQKTCSSLLDFLSTSEPHNNRLLIEFPSKSYLSKAKISECVTGLKTKGYATSYYVPTSEAISCSQALARGRTFNDEKTCISLREDLQLAADSTLFTDFSFDYSGVLAMESIEFTRKFKWNTWDVTPELFDRIQPERFRMVNLRDNDPNNL